MAIKLSRHTGLVAKAALLFLVGGFFSAIALHAVAQPESVGPGFAFVLLMLGVVTSVFTGAFGLYWIIVAALGAVGLGMTAEELTAEKTRDMPPPSVPRPPATTEELNQLVRNLAGDQSSKGKQ